MNCGQEHSWHVECAVCKCANLEARVKELESDLSNIRNDQLYVSAANARDKLQDENARLRSDLDSCSASHQKQNAYVEKLENVVDAAMEITAYREEPFPGTYTSILTTEAKALYEACRELDGVEKC